MILNIGGGGGLPIRLIVTAPTGSAVSVTQDTTVLAANEVDGVWTFAIPSLGVWTIHATIEGQSLTQDVDVSKVGQYNVTLEAPVKTTLNDNDWATIKSVADESKGANYWAVGDCKQITINGKLSDGLTLSNYNTWVYIIGFDHNGEREGTGIAFQGFKTAQSGGTDICLCDSGYYSNKYSGQWFNMNNNNSTSGGWGGCNMRNNTLPIVKVALPSDLQAVIKTTALYTDNTGGSSTSPSYVTQTQDELYLLAEFEIFGARKYANTAEQNYQQQYAYYVSGNSKIKYKHDNTATTAHWWDRSVSSADTTRFCRVYTNGTASADSASDSLGLAPAFKVGGAKYTPLDYISATGTQYIDTGLIVNKSDSYRMVLDTDLTSSENYAGCNGYMQFQANVGEGARSTIDITYKNITETITVNGTQKSSQSWSSYNGVDVKLGIFKMGDANNTWFNGTPQSGKLYSCKIYKDDVLVRDMIPAKDEVGNVGLYDKIGEKFYYNSGTGIFAIPGVRQANSVGVGASLFAEEDGTKTEFIVVNQGNPNTSKYDSTCDGTWLVRKDIYGTCDFGDASASRYEDSTLNDSMETYQTKLNIVDIIKTVNIPIITTNDFNTWSVKCFALSPTETQIASYNGDGAPLTYFSSAESRIAYYNNKATRYWTRVARYRDDFGDWSTTGSTCISATGELVGVRNTSYEGYRPAFIIPSDTYIDENNNILTAPPYNAISTLNVGDSVFCKEDGVDTEYLLVHKGNPDTSMYDSSCNGAWLLRKTAKTDMQWDETDANYPTSGINTWMNGTFYNTLNVKSIISQVKIPYSDPDVYNAVHSGSDGLSTKIFLLSCKETGAEVGGTLLNGKMSNEGTVLDWFAANSANRKFTSTWWLRSVNNEDKYDAWFIYADGTYGVWDTTKIYSARPAFIVPLDTPIDSSNNIIA